MPLVLDGTNGVSGVDGTASNPAIEGTDSNTGIFYPAADTVAIGTGGTERLRVDSSGNVGVGTSSPALPIDVVSNSGSLALSIRGRSSDDIGTLMYYTNNGVTNTAQIQMRPNDNEFRFAALGARSQTFYTNGSERMRLDSSGNVGIGTSSPTNFGAGFTVGQINGSSGGYLLVSQAGTTSIGEFGTESGLVYVGSRSTNTPIVFRQNGTTERARITSAGAFVVAKTSAVLSIAGSYLQEDGFIGATRSGNACIGVNRLTNDGQLIFFQQAGVEEGNISVSGNTVSYNPFLGSHAGAFADWSRPEVKIGTIFETINELIDYKVVAIEVEDVPKRISYNGNGAVGTTATVEYEGQEYTGIIENERGQERDFNKHVKVKINDTPDSKAVYGVFVGWNTDSSNDGGVYNDMLIGAVGNYVIRMAAGQTPEIGDLVKADGTGCAIVQEDDIVRTKTVGKITNTIPQLTYEDGSFLVACVLYCG